MDVTPQTYAALEKLATRSGSSVERMLELAVEDFARRQDSSPAEWLQRWHDVQSEIQRKMPAGISDDEIEREIDRAVAEVRTARRAGGH